MPQNYTETGILLSIGEQGLSFLVIHTRNGLLSAVGHMHLLNPPKFFTSDLVLGGFSVYKYKTRPATICRTGMY